MNNVRSLFVLSVFCAEVSWVLLIHQPASTPSTNQRSNPATNQAGEPLLLTPLIDAGKLKEARNRSRVNLLKEIESYAGFLTINETSKSYLYFWFTPKTVASNYASSPVMLWLQGGPGCSSLYGLFDEHGPFEVTKNNSVKRRVHAWTNNYHMLYIDQPLGAGFSFSEKNEYVTTEREVAAHLYAALVQFFELFSEFKDHDFYIAGESYAGKYIPAIGHKIHHVTRQQPNVDHIRLKGMMIGNGFSDPENMLEYAAFLHETGMVDGRERQELEAIQDEIRYQIQSGNWTQATSWFNSRLFKKIEHFTGISSTYDYRIDRDANDSYIEFINSDRVRRLVHVGNRTYEPCSRTVSRQFKMDYMQTERPTLEELLDHYPVLFYNGQFDIICAHWLTENYLDKLHWAGAAKYASAKKQVWRVGNRVAGYYKSGSNLVYAMVRNAGHMVPLDQPENVLNLIDMFIGKKLQDNSTPSSEKKGDSIVRQ